MFSSDSPDAGRSSAWLGFELSRLLRLNSFPDILDSLSVNQGEAHLPFLSQKRICQPSRLPPKKRKAQRLQKGLL